MDDQGFLKGINLSDERIFSKFFEAYWRDLYLYAYRILDNKEESVDIVQDTFASIWENRDKLAHVESLKAYTYTIVRFKSIKCIKNNIKLKRLKEELAAIYPTQSNSLTDESDIQSLKKFIQEEIQKLPPRMREVFVLSRNNYLSYREIADKLKISENTVKKQVSNSIRQIRMAFLGDNLPLLFFFFDILFFFS